MAVREALTHALSLAAGAKNLISAGLQSPPSAPARAVLIPHLAAADTRQDGWVNVATGLGTSRDKTGGTYYCAPGWLSDAELADLYNFHDLAAKCVNLPIREAFKSGYELGGLDDPDRLKEITNYLKPFALLSHTKQAATWADLFGGSALWFRFADGQDPSTPLQAPLDLTPTDTGPSAPVRALPRIDAIEVVDKRFLFPFRWYTDGPKAGRPMTYQLWVPRNGGVNSLMGEIHETRLVCFYSCAPTEALDKIRRQGWNQPVLQRVYEALQSSGIVWKAIDILVADANQAVYSIAGLWKMIAGDPTQGQDSQASTGTPSGGLLNRIRFMDLMRSVSRAIVLDKDDETFERKPTNFASLPELSERQWVRVSAASDIPIPLLTGEYPSGLQSNGEGPFRVFYAGVASRREEDFGPRLLESIRLILSAEGAPPLSAQELANLSIEWLPLWEPTAQELADIRLKRVQEGDALVQAQAMTAEEFAMSLPEEWWPALDRKRLQAAIDEQRAAPDDEQATATLELTPTDIAAVVTVNQALASVGLPDMPGADGSLTVEAYRAKALAAGTAEGTPKPPPGAAPPAGRPAPFGKAGAAPARTDGKDHTAKQAAMGRWIVRHDDNDFALAWGSSKVA